MDDTVPVWHYALADALIEKRVLMAPGQNTTYLHFRVLRASDTLELELTPLCTYREYHSHNHGGCNNRGQSNIIYTKKGRATTKENRHPPINATLTP
ncbi:MAG: glycogen debranching enzyme N-terminal domain-containing protein [Candidatus Nitrotoga sp.]